MTADTLLSRLDHPRQTGKDRWLARCPAHADKSPSMTIRELDDGRVLIHCFAGCSTADILAAVGLEFSDLFPPKPVTDTYLPRERRLHHAGDVLAALATEALVVDCAIGTMQRRGWLTDDECDRLALASDRITGGLAYASAHV